MGIKHFAKVECQVKTGPKGKAEKFSKKEKINMSRYGSEWTIENYKNKLQVCPQFFDINLKESSHLKFV